MITNPIQIIQMITKSNNPQQMAQNMFGQNPAYQRALQMTQGKSPQEIQEIAKNLCNQRGIDFNQIIKQIESMGIKMPL